MPHASRCLAVAACLAVTLAASSPALAQADADRATARALGQDGQRALDAKDFKTAEDDFRRADTLVHAPTLLLGLARALAGEGKFVEAQETYKRIVREGVAPGAPDVFTRAVDDAKREVLDVEPRIGGMTIRVQATGGAAIPNVKVVIDDAPVNAASLGIRRLVDPGPHVVRASADGYKSAELKVTVAPGGSVDAPLTLDPDPTAAAVPAPAVTPATPPPATDQKPVPDQTPQSGGGTIWPWVAFGVGGVGLGVGIVGGVLALGKHSDLANNCSGGACGPAQQSELDSYHTMGLVSTVGFVVAGVGAAAGVTLLILQPKGGAPPASGLHVVPAVGPGSIGAVGTF
jgi:hypothetical protein